MSAAEQARVFLAMALCGAAGGALYDALLLLRRMAGGGKLVTGTLDLLFGVGLAVLMTLTGLVLQVDPFRLYAFAGVGAGLALYAFTVGAAVRAVLALPARWVKKRQKMSGKGQEDAGK